MLILISEDILAAEPWPRYFRPEVLSFNYKMWLISLMALKVVLLMNSSLADHWRFYHSAGSRFQIPAGSTQGPVSYGADSVSLPCQTSPKTLHYLLPHSLSYKLPLLFSICSFTILHKYMTLDNAGWGHPWALVDHKMRKPPVANDSSMCKGYEQCKQP